jgi:hypothetical protein
MTAELDRNQSITVGTDNTTISEAVNTSISHRVSFTLINTSTAGQVINISFTDEAGSGKGIQLSVGGYYAESQDAGFKPRNSRISAISSAAGGTLAVSERIVVER